MKIDRIKRRKNIKVLNKKLKKNEWYVIFAKNCSMLYIGLKYWNNIDIDFKNEKKYKVVILNNREILNGMENNFKEYFNIFKDITSYINEEEIECIIDFNDDEYNILRQILGAIVEM